MSTGFDLVRNPEGQIIGFRLPAPPRYRYFQKKRGPMFCWTTERFEGAWGSFVLVPVGTGSRSDQAEEWEMDDDSISAHELRKEAKARALKLFKAWEGGEARPWS